MQSLPDLEGMSLFVRIVESGSLSAAGRSLGMPKATVSRRLSDLEARLGLRLINRSTRSLSLTDGGRAYHRRCVPIVAEAEAAELEVLAKTGTPSGLVRLTAPVGLGQMVLMPHLTEFLRLYPQVSFDLEFADRQVDVIAEGFDVAIRSGALDDSSLVARRLLSYRRILVASPTYLAGAPALAAPEDLRCHMAILLDPERPDWTLETPSGDVVVRVRWRLAVRNIFALREAAVAGQGVAFLPDYVVADDLAAGRLVRVLKSVVSPPVAASVIYPSARTQAPAVRCLINFLTEALKEQRTTRR